MIIEKILDALDRLLEQNDNLMMRHVSREFCSYRGYYEHLAMARSEGRVMAAVAFYNELANQIGATYYGYKGGEFTMHGRTELFVAEYGRTGEWVVGVDIDEDGYAHLVTSETDFNGF